MGEFDSNKPVAVSVRWHNALKYLSTMRGMRSSRSVSVKELVELALEDKYGPLEEIDKERQSMKLPGDVKQDRAEKYEMLDRPENEDKLFAEIVSAALIHNDTNDYIEQFPDEMRVRDDLGRPLCKVKSIAYFLRTVNRNGARVNNLRDLMLRFKFGRDGSEQVRGGEDEG